VVCVGLGRRKTRRTLTSHAVPALTSLFEDSLLLHRMDEDEGDKCWQCVSPSHFSCFQNNHVYYQLHFSAIETCVQTGPETRWPKIVAKAKEAWLARLFKPTLFSPFKFIWKTSFRSSTRWKHPLWSQKGWKDPFYLTGFAIVLVLDKKNSGKKF
jgi:hypothetical protein